jgi:nicotinate-nucleotide--dimethylbenzimidazole phosphoribosyltransferase
VAPARSLLAALADYPAHPLRALRRHGTGEIAVLCGVALGAGEHGLGCVCDGLAALAGAAVAAAIEPTLRPRVRAIGEDDHAAHLGIAIVDGDELAAALD